MKILVGANNEYTIPLADNLVHAPLRISYAIADGLSKNGNDISILCAKNSRSYLKQITPEIISLGEFLPDEQKANYDQRFISQLVEIFESSLYLKLKEIQNEKFALIHLNPTNILSCMPYIIELQTPVVITLHMPSSQIINELIEKFLVNTNNKIHFVSISNYQKTLYNRDRVVGTVYHGVDTKAFTFNEFGGEDMLFIGRIKKEKGIEEAIHVSLKTRHSLRIAGHIRASAVNYFEVTIKPLIEANPNLMHFLQFINYSLTNPFFQKGKLFLFPIQWEEPFGLVMIESMATGTPVVAFARGSVPEVIKDGETGFIINPSDEDIRGNWIIKKNGIEGFCEAVERIYSLNEQQYKQLRLNCRAHVEKYFTTTKMVNEYENLYKKVLSL